MPATRNTETSQSNKRPFLWGCLVPLSTGVKTIDFSLKTMKYTVGRNREINRVILQGNFISNQHCTIEWNGSKEDAEFTVHDWSTNGTYVNMARIGNRQKRRIYDGQILAFGTPLKRPESKESEDYRYEFKVLGVRASSKRELEDNFYLGEDLGQGAFANVRKVTQKWTGKTYAVKMLLPTRQFPNNAGNSATAREKSFEREIKVLHSLKHPNICNLIDVFSDELNHKAIVLEFCAGGNLYQRLQDSYFLDEEEGKHITYQICDALSYIHSKGIIHGDLKPDNILLSLDEPPVVKVADFGISRDLNAELQPVLGHADEEFLPPEASSRNSRFILSDKIDSWALGVTVFYMLMGYSPFPERDCLTQIDRVGRKRADWNRVCGGSSEALSFMMSLIDIQHGRRMSVTAALQHKWLKFYIPFYCLTGGDSTLDVENRRDVSS